MLTQQKVKEMVKSKELKSGAIDGRDFSRLIEFFPVDDWPLFGFALKEDAKVAPDPKPWTEDAVKGQLTEDVAFGFEKALDQRGISASCMHAVVVMWMVILEDPLKDQDAELYAQYGLPYLKAVALKYGLNNPIGDHNGDEERYSADGAR